MPRSVLKKFKLPNHPCEFKAVFEYVDTAGGPGDLFLSFEPNTGLSEEDRDDALSLKSRVEASYLSSGAARAALSAAIARHELSGL